MMIYVIAPFLVLAIVELIYIKRLEAHDSVLFRFCDIRRSLMKHLRTKGLEMSRQDYLAARELLNGIDDIIHDYNDCKRSVLNLRVLKKMLRQYRDDVEEIKESVKTTDPVLVQLRSRTRRALLHGFLTYTPFFKHQLFLRFVIFCVGILAQAGLTRLKEYQLSLHQMTHLIRAESQGNNEMFPKGGLRI